MKNSKLLKLIPNVFWVFKNSLITNKQWLLRRVFSRYQVAH
ncbi:hypothetical protein FA947_02350 [Mycoplasmoides pneumoniae]|nr:hypothetical protein FA919_02350 [Mycoplasmoides pneumoniae]QHR04662.1 hypothetical protein FA920_02350 [Mycoplasmoides pneumoniae]QHR05365.1 hypothetical protein FA921_02355 [Mycoplasmoides pneumoniae]QHR06070.1 hypothetical protein FA922_02350 [Mycoplasmoides pneumoniae]QHR06773.1 hypothetical protein FA923_02350 [Mycoplasmoides pneumoniae]